MTFGWGNAWYNGLATDLDNKYANAVGHVIESTINYIKPWDITQGYTNTVADFVNDYSHNPSRMRPFYFDLMVPWANEPVPKRDLSVTVDIAPQEPSGPGGHWISGPGGEDVTAITNWHNQMIAGTWDPAWIAFANMLVSVGGANWHVRPWHEPTWWNFWTSTVDYPGWLASFNRMISVFRAHGLTGRMGPSLDGVSSANYLASNFPGSDCAFFDTYTNIAPGQAVNAGVVNYCRSKGMLLNFAEIGVARYPDGSQDSDARGVTFFTEIHNWILANQDVYEGMCYYNDNGSADITTGSYPQTLAYIRNNMATWEISGTGGGGGGGPIGTNTATVTGSSTTAFFSGTVVSTVQNVTIYRDTYGGTKISDNAPAADGTWSYSLGGETNGPHVYVVAMFSGTPGSGVFVPPGPFTLNLTIDSTAPTTITNRANPVIVTGANGGSLNITWPSGGSAPQAGDVAILGVAVGSGGAVNTPTGFTFQTRADNSTQVGIAIYTKVCTGSETGTIAVTANFGLMHLSLHVKVGVSTANPIDVTPQSNTASVTTTVAIPSVSTITINTLLMTFAMAVKYGDAATYTWTPPPALTEIVDVFGLEGGVHGKGYEVCEHSYSNGGATGINTATYGAQFSYGVGLAVPIRPGAPIPPTESLTGITFTKDLGHVAIIIAAVTAGIATVEVSEGGVLQGTAVPAQSAATVALSFPQSVGLHNYSIIGKNASGVQVAGPYAASVTVLDAPLVVSVATSLNSVTINANTVTTIVRIYETLVHGGAQVGPDHLVDSNYRYTTTTGLTAGRSYDATAFDGTHESARVTFTTVTAPGVTSIDSVNVASTGLVTIIWQGASLQLFGSGATPLIQTVLLGTARPLPLVGYIYSTSLPDGHYTVTAYDNVVPASAIVTDTAAFDVAVVAPPSTNTGHAVETRSGHIIKTESGHIIKL